MAESLSAQLSRLGLSGSGGSCGGSGGGDDRALLARQLLDNLTNREAVEYIKDGKAMILLRGVPGSGKSTIVGKLRSLLNTDAICSADDFFVRGGTYRFDRSKIKDAHEWCHQKAENYCQKGEPVVIIDNTHVKAWETRFYTGLARTNGYMVFAIIPPRQFTTSARTLTRENKHGVEEKIILQKLQDFDILYPYFYGWFFNTQQASKLHGLGHKTMKQIKRTSLNGTFPPYDSEQTGLHVTAQYFGRHVDEMSKARALSELSRHIGCVDPVTLLDVVITKNTLAVRVSLKQEAKRFYRNDTPEFYQDKHGYASLPEGFAAHITLSCAAGVPPHMAKSDVILAGLCEINNENHTKVNEHITYYATHQLAVFKLPKKHDMPAIFAHCL